MNWVRIAALSMALTVILGSFGAHALKAKLTPEMLEIFRVGVLYQIIYSLSIFVAAWRLSMGFPKANTAAWLFLAGILFFSGSLYGLSLSGIKALGAVTPIGGLCFLVGWIVLAL